MFVDRFGVIVKKGDWLLVDYDDFYEKIQVEGINTEKTFAWIQYDGGNSRLRSTDVIKLPSDEAERDQKLMLYQLEGHKILDDFFEDR